MPYTSQLVDKMPAEWTRVTLGDLFTFHTVKTNSDHVPTNVPTVKPGDIVVVTHSLQGENEMKVFQVEEDTPLPRRAFLLRPKPEAMASLPFLFRMLQQKNLQRSILMNASASHSSGILYASTWNLARTLKETTVAVPDEATQHTIMKCLNKQIDIYRALLKNTQDLHDTQVKMGDAIEREILMGRMGEKDVAGHLKKVLFTMGRITDNPATPEKIYSSQDAASAGEGKSFVSLEEYQARVGELEQALGRAREAQAKVGDERGAVSVQPVEVEEPEIPRGITEETGSKQKERLLAAGRATLERVKSKSKP